jgi:hypothetical protein
MPRSYVADFARRRRIGALPDSSEPLISGPTEAANHIDVSTLKVVNVAPRRVLFGDQTPRRVVPDRQVDGPTVCATGWSTSAHGRGDPATNGAARVPTIQAIDRKDQPMMHHERHDGETTRSIRARLLVAILNLLVNIGRFVMQWRLGPPC